MSELSRLSDCAPMRVHLVVVSTRSQDVREVGGVRIPSATPASKPAPAAPPPPPRRRSRAHRRVRARLTEAAAGAAAMPS